MFENMPENLGQLINESIEKYGDKPALGYFDREPLSYIELGEKIKKLAAFMISKGINKGDRVAILSQNNPNWGVSYFAIASIGAIVVPILTDFHESEVHHILRHSGVRAVFVSDDLYYKISDTDFENLECRILINDFSLIEAETTKEKLKQLLASGGSRLKKAFDTVRGHKIENLHEPDADDIAVIIYTSGTTGHSKGVMLSHKNIITDAVATTAIVDVDRSDSTLSILPLAHVYESTLGLVTMMMQGAYVNYLGKRPTASILLPALKKVKPTIMLSVPMIIEKIHKERVVPEIQSKAILNKAYGVNFLRKKINKLAGKKLLKTFGGNLKMFCIGGAALAPETEKFLREAGFPYAVGYGLTETSPLVIGTNQYKTKYLSTGVPLPGVEIKIGNPDPKTGEGLIMVRGDMVMKGYYKDPELTSEVIDKDGWLNTGDLAAKGEDGYYYFKGRLKNVIVGPSGENIYPEIIESVINRFETVLESVVYERQQKLIARVHLNYEKLDKFFTEKKLTGNQIREYISELLTNLKQQVNKNVSSFSRISEFVEQTEPFEKTPTLKIKRYLYVD